MANSKKKGPSKRKGKRKKKACTSKKRYTNEVEAREHAKQLRKAGHKNQRYFRCPECSTTNRSIYHVGGK